MDNEILRQVTHLLSGPGPITDETIENTHRLAASLTLEEHKLHAYELIIAALLRKQQPAKVETLAEEMPPSYEKAAAFRALAMQALQTNQVQEALRLLGRAESVPRDLDIEWEIAEALNRVAELYSRSGDSGEAEHYWTRAIQAARSGEKSENEQHNLDASSMLWEIAESLALAGQTSRAMEVAEAIRSEGKRARALAALKRIANGRPGSFRRQR